MNGHVVPFPTASRAGGTSCPPWCVHATIGHAYRYGLDDSNPPVFHRLHTAQFADLAGGMARIDLHQLETTRDPDVPGDLGPAEVVLSAPADEAVHLADSQSVEMLIEGLQAACTRLAQATEHAEERTQD